MHVFRIHIYLALRIVHARKKKFNSSCIFHLTTNQTLNYHRYYCAARRFIELQFRDTNGTYLLSRSHGRRRSAKGRRGSSTQSTRRAIRLPATLLLTEKSLSNAAACQTSATSTTTPPRTGYVPNRSPRTSYITPLSNNYILVFSFFPIFDLTKKKKKTSNCLDTGRQLRGSAKPANVNRIRRFQSRVLRTITEAPFYVSKSYITQRPSHLSMQLRPSIQTF